jgi:hypothetical protein
MSCKENFWEKLNWIKKCFFIIIEAYEKLTHCLTLLDEVIEVLIGFSLEFLLRS